MAILRWFDETPGCYWAIAWLAWGGLVVATALQIVADWYPGHALARRNPRWCGRPSGFVLVAILAVFAFRWPMIFAGPLMNPDETQHGAAAITYWLDPVPWRSVDLHTSGPLNAYFLWPAMLFDGRIGYPGLRVMALIAHLGAALSAYGFFRRLTTESLARLAALPFLTFIAFTAHWEFVQFTSEQLSFLLLGAATWLIAAALTRPIPETGSARVGSLFAAGICLGAQPFAKMQAVPLALTVGCFGLVGCWFAVIANSGTRRRRLTALLAGAITPGVIMALVLTLYGLWAQFYAAYIQSNATYLVGYENARIELLRNFIATFVTYSDGFAPYFWSALGVGLAAALFTGISRLQPRALLLGAWVLVALGFWTVVYPGRPFGHYLHFLMLPLAWVCGLSLIAVQRNAALSLEGRWAGPARIWTAVIFGLLTLVPQIVTRVGEAHVALGKLVEAHENSLHPVSARLLTLARPGDTMMVWGWFPRLHSETGIPQGTRESNNYREIEGGAMQQFFRDRTMRDLRRNRPAIFVDSVCEGSFTYTDRKTAGLQVFPELERYVADNYTLEEELDGYRIYLRNER